MLITEEKLLQWSIQESTDLSSNAYHFIRDEIEKTEFYKNNSSVMGIYLQGSYANATNIRRDADVDIVLQCNRTFNFEIEKLSDYQKQKFNESFSSATLSFVDYKKTIYNQLIYKLKGLSRFKEMEYGAKSLKITLQNPSIKVDVVPCFQQRDYYTFSEAVPYSSNSYHEGISFLDTETNDRIINYPKLHRANGEAKNQKHRSNGRFKESVRYIKKIRNLLEEAGYLMDGEMPSYFIENLLFNVPDSLFDEFSVLKTFNSIVDFLKDTTELNNFMCQHKQWKLFGERSTQWNLVDAKKFISLLVQVKDGKLI